MADNIVTFYDPRPGQFCFKSPELLVEIDGERADWLGVKQIIYRAGSALNQVCLAVKENLSGSEARLENMATCARSGQRIMVVLETNADAIGNQKIRWPLFEGVVFQGQVDMSGRQELMDVYGCDRAAYDRKAIDGTRVWNGSDIIHLNGEKVVFNPAGRPNCSLNKVSGDGYSGHVFCHTGQGKHWSGAKAIWYLASIYFSNMVTKAEDYEYLEGLAGGHILRDVDVAGMSILGALDKVCHEVGLNYFVDYVPVEGQRCRTKFCFYEIGKGRKVLLSHQRAGNELNLRETNLAECSLKSKCLSESIQVVGRGDYKRFEGTFELLEGWDSGLEGNDFEFYSPEHNENFALVKDVYRRWVLNESGAYSGEPYSRGAAYDLSALLGTGLYEKRKRRFWPCLSRDMHGESLGYYLEVSYDGGSEWQKYPGMFHNLQDECGVYLSSNEFSGEMQAAILGNTLRLRVTASVISDERLEVVVNDGSIDTMRPVRRVCYDWGGLFEYKQVTSESVFWGDKSGQLSLADVVDDKASLRERVRNQLALLRREELTGQIRLPWLRADIKPGAVIDKVSGRNLDVSSMSLRSGYRPQIGQVKFELENDWRTEISFS